MAVHHLTVNINYLLNNFSEEKLGELFLADGKECKKELESLLAKGHKLIPSENCKHFDPVEGCKCHLH